MHTSRIAYLLISLGIGFICCARVPSTLDDFIQYANTLPELTSWTNSWSDPDFGSIYVAQRPGPFHFLKRLLSSAPEWNFAEFASLVGRAIEVQKKLPKHEKVQVLSLTEGERSVFWGDIHGAYHSFLRDLKELEQQGIITQDLHIAKGCHFILVGDDMSRSPYALQQLSLELLLFERNPSQCYYLSSPLEQEGRWKSFLSLRLPLIIYGSTLRDGWLKRAGEHLPIEGRLDELFRGFPEALLLRYADGGSQGQVYCAYDITPNEIIKSAKTEAILLGETSRSLAKGYTGLDFVGYDYGATYWSLLSSPVKVYQDHLGFYHDSFAIMTVGKTLRDTYLTHYFRDVREKDPAFKTSFGDLVTGMVRTTLQELRTYQQMPIYKFGSSLALFGGYGASGVAIKEGMVAAAVQLNEEGGVNGHLLYPVILDDEYTGRLAALNARRLTDEYKTDVFVSPQGTPTLDGYLSRVEKGEIAVLFPRSGAVKFYNKNLKYLVNGIASVGDEVYALMDQMVNEFKVRTFAFLYPKDTFGLSFMQTVKKELARYGITSSDDMVYQPGQADLTEEIKKLRDSADEGVGIFLTGNAPIREFLSGLGMIFFLSKVVFTTSFLDSAPFTQFAWEHGIKFTMSYPVPDPRAVKLPIFQDLFKAVKPFGLAYNASLFEGYFAVKLFADALKHLKPPFTKEAILHYLEGLQHYSFGGIELTFNPETRDFGMPVFVITSEDRWVEYKNRRRVAEGELMKSGVEREGEG